MATRCRFATRTWSLPLLRRTRSIRPAAVDAEVLDVRAERLRDSGVGAQQCGGAGGLRRASAPATSSKATAWSRLGQARGSGGDGVEPGQPIDMTARIK